jgi:cytochrome oxidase Cu insertion factor (SCO1/SenC/PrrC family)
VPGMNSGLNPADPALVAAFRSALMHQGAIVGVIFLLLLLAWGATRGWVTAGTQARAVLAAAWHEPKARRLLRVGFGLLWLFDGILQAQPQMAGGLPSKVMEPAASSSPAWVQNVVNWGSTIWTYHPIQAAAASVWIQVGIGLWLIFGVRGWASRLAGVASVAWGLIVWAFGEAFGQIFAPGLTVLFGAPGAVLVYAVAGVLVALPERVWQTPRTGRLILAGMGTFFAGMALLQAWPGRGFWQGRIGGQPGTLTGMVQSMAGTSQPHVLAVIVSSFGGFTAAHGFAVNLFAVVVLAALGVIFLSGRPWLVRIGVIAGAVFCLADWVLVEDLGFLGGLGTDPNSMIPLILLFTAGYLALTPAAQPEPAMQPVAEPAPAQPAVIASAAAAAAAAETAAAAARPATAAAAGPATAAAAETAAAAVGSPAAQSMTASATAAVTGAAAAAATAESAAAGTGAIASAAAAAMAAETGAPAAAAAAESPAAQPGSTPPEAAPPAPGAWPARVPAWLPAALHPAAVRESVAALSGRTVAALGAVGVILVGAAPMALASANHNADPIIAQALAGASGQLDTPAPGFTLTSQDGRSVSLASLRGKVVLLTFMDPVCVTDCPIIAQEMRAADTLLGAKASGVELVAVVANPTYTSTAFTVAFTRQEGFAQVSNWLFLTGPLSQLQAVWQHYGIQVENLPAGAMSAHNDLAYVIDAAGQVREEISDDPGPGTAATKSSFAGLLANAVIQTMGQGQ